MFAASYRQTALSQSMCVSRFRSCWALAAEILWWALAAEILKSIPVGRKLSYPCIIAQHFPVVLPQGYPHSATPQQELRQESVQPLSPFLSFRIHVYH